MAKTHILFNAHSLDQHPQSWREVEKYIRLRNLDWHMVPPEANALKSQAERALYDGASLIGVVGGDGSVREMAAALVGTGCALGILPAGTGNDFCRAARIPKRMDRALELLRTGEDRSIDLGRCNGEIFINVAGMGFDALVVKNAMRYKTKGLGRSWAYLHSVFYTLGHMETYPIQKIGGMTGNLPKEMLMVAAGNGHFIGGGMKVTPLAELDDGLLDICLVGKVSLGRFLLLFPGFLGGRHIKAENIVHYEKTTRLEIEFDRQIPMQLDGELREADRFAVEILPQALKLRMARKG